MNDNAGNASESIRSRILAQIDLTRETDDEELSDLIRNEVISYGRDHTLSLADRITLEKEIFNSLRKLDILQDLLEDDDITEIMINSPKDIFVEKRGEIHRLDRGFSSDEKLSDVIQQIVADNNKVVNESMPIVDTRLSDGSRVNIVLSPVAIDYSILSIRRFPKEIITMDRLMELGSLSPEVADFLKKIVNARYNIFLSGGTSSGKTTFLGALTEYINSSERVITIEDSAELRVIGIDNLVRLEARSANLEGRLEITIRDLIKTSLRLRPDRIIVGEVRGAEALDMLQACNTGHDGSLSTGHANSNEDMLSRLETMVLMGMELPVSAIRQQIASGIDIMIHLGRLRDRSRKLLEISEVAGIEDGIIRLSPLYVYEASEGVWQKKNELIHTKKMSLAGY